MYCEKKKLFLSVDNEVLPRREDKKTSYQKAMKRGLDNFQKLHHDNPSVLHRLKTLFRNKLSLFCRLFNQRRVEIAEKLIINYHCCPK